MPSRQRLTQLAHVAAGLCHLCSRPLHPGSKSLCYHHLVKKRTANRKKLGLKAGHKSGKGRPAITRTPSLGELLQDTHSYKPVTTKPSPSDFPSEGELAA